MLNQNLLICWSIVVKDKPTVGSPFVKAFPSARISKATKDVNVHLFIHRFTFTDELLVDSALAGNNFSLNYTCEFPFLLQLVRGMRDMYVSLSLCCMCILDWGG